MAAKISAESLNGLLHGDAPFGLIDIREAVEFNTSHMPGSTWIPRRLLEFQIKDAVPFTGANVVLCDDDGRRAERAAATLERFGYGNVSFLEAGINGWASQDYPTEWGTNVPSKDFGEKMEVVHHVPELEAVDLHQRIERGDKLVILDTRTPEEYQRFCIPGGRSVPGGELALRISDIAKDLDPDTTVIVNYAGRTRSIIGTRALQRMGWSNVLGLKNGTSGWVLAGFELESGADRVSLPEVSSEGLAAAEAYADRIAAEDGVRFIDITKLQQLISRRGQETIYLIDVRTREEYQQGHIPGFRWFPGGQAVQRSDDAVPVHNSTIVLTCDKKARATITGSWYRQMGYEEVYVLEGGIGAWGALGQSLESGMPESPVLGLAEARQQAEVKSTDDFQRTDTGVTIFVDTSQDFAAGHIPGSHWLSRSWLDLDINTVAPSLETAIGLICSDGTNSILAAAALKELGYMKVTVLEGGMAAWRRAGLPVETGLTGVMRPPVDVLYAGPDRSYADMVNYLRWETALGGKYAADR